MNSEARLTTPMIKQGGQWVAVDWNQALSFVADGLKRIKTEFGAASIGAIGSVHSTIEELHLLAKLVRGMGSDNVDHRTRHADFSNAAPAGHARWLGMPITALSQLDRALVVGSFLRKDHPLFAARLRHATRRGARVHSVHALRDDWLMTQAAGIAVAPAAWPQALAEIAAAIAATQGIASPVAAVASDEAKAIAQSMLGGERRAVLLGNAAAQHPQAAQLLALAQWIAEQVGAHCGYLGEAANSVGAQLVGAMPRSGGLHAGAMLSQPMKALLLLNTEPALDAADAAAAKRALSESGLVVALSSFRDAAVDNADVLLPIAPFTETAGCFVNAEGRVQSFHGVVPPLGETRPAWKVLRVLGNLLGLDGFAFESVDEVRTEALGDVGGIAQRLDNGAQASAPVPPLTNDMTSLQRLADVPIYATDMLVRRARSLQLTADARPPVVGVPSALWAQLGIEPGGKVLVAQGQGAVVMSAREDKTLAANAVRVSAGHPATLALGAMFGPITVEKA